jgi:hypothetical protein
MRRTEPPTLATWMLEHCIPGDYDEALAGDLLEEFRSGRSVGWFWRQALAAWFVGWLKYLSRRRSLLIFAAAWSTLAPAWASFVDSIEHSRSMLNPAWGLSHLFSMFWLWVALNVGFIWTGMLLFVMVHSRFASSFSRVKLRRAFRLVPFIFLPMYFVTFVLMNLFAYPGFDIDQGALTPIGEIADWKMRADALRIPYFLTILWTMWAATPLMSTLSPTSVAWRPVRLPNQAGTSAANAVSKPSLDTYTAKRFLVLMIGAGLLNALIAGFLICRLPPSHTPSIGSLAARAIFYVAAGALAGMAGIYLYWNSPSSPFRTAPPLPFSLFALASAAGWIWVPSMVIFSEQLSSATALVGAIGAFLLTAALRHATSSLFAPVPRTPHSETDEGELFNESLYCAPREVHGYVIAICLYAAGWALATRSNYTACALLALSAALFAWKRTFAPGQQLDTDREYKRAALRLALVFIPAVLVTIWSLIDGVGHRNRLEAIAAAQSRDNAQFPGDDAARKSQPDAHPSATGISGYESIVLWPLPEKKQIIPPLPAPSTLLAPGTSQPLVIRFDGPYLYFQAGRRPGTTAHQARDTPLAVHIQSTNAMPLTIEAHQSLGTPIRLTRCREMQVEIANRDNEPGVVALAILLTDSTAPGKPSLYVGQQPLETTQPGRFFIKSSPAYESLRFAIPARASIRKFDEITVMLLPDIEHALVGPRIAIQQFQLFPR